MFLSNRVDNGSKGAKNGPKEVKKYQKAKNVSFGQKMLFLPKQIGGLGGAVLPPPLTEDVFGGNILQIRGYPFSENIFQTVFDPLPRHCTLPKGLSFLKGMFATDKTVAKFSFL